MNASAATRPEERRRRDDGYGDGPAWADTVPACFRSEAFAEDLLETPAALPARPPQRLACAREAGPALAAQSAR